jgi:predicted transport protein
MADIKLFRIETDNVRELASTTVAIERSLQTQLERHLQDFLGVQFLASEYGTGKTHAGRIDTLGLDEDSCPVIIEYKKATDANVITQGLYYLDWLMDHRAEFELLVMRKLGNNAHEEIDWSAPRLICIAGDFNKFDEHAVLQIPRNISLIRYRKYGGELLLLELVNATRVTGQRPLAVFPEASVAEVGLVGAKLKPEYTGFVDLLVVCSVELHDLWQSIDEYLRALGDEVQVHQRKYYVAYRRIKNFAAVEVHPRAGFHVIFVKVDPASVLLREGFTRDVSNIGHYGTGDLEIRIRTLADLEAAKPLIIRSYEEN